MSHIPDTTEEIIPNVTVEWYADRRIVGYTVRTIARPTIDFYGQHMLKILQEWPAGQTYLTMQDFAEKSIAFTPLLRHYVDAVNAARPDIEHYTALLMPQTFLAEVAKAFIRLHNKPGKLEVRLCSSRSEALDWLWSKIPDSADARSRVSREK